MRDHVSVRIKFDDYGEAVAHEIIEVLNDHFDGLKFGKPSEGGNPRYKPGGDKYDPGQPVQKLVYSRLRQKNYNKLLPVRKKR